MNREQVLAQVQQHLASHPEVTGAAQIAEVIRQTAGVVSDKDVFDLLRQLRHETVGLGPLEPLLQRRGITDIVVNGPNSVWIDCGNGMEAAGVRFSDDEEVRRLATRLILACGGRLDSAQSFADARLQHTATTAIRVHAMLSPPSDTGTLLSLRVLRQAHISLGELAEKGTFTRDIADALRALVHAKRSFLVVGGTGSGKTTLLNALLGEVHPGERIITIEDTAELLPKHPHHVALLTRAANTEGRGQITMQELLKQALRMRPDRIILGEIRGAEVVDLLAALNTGHEGCAGTIHANAAEEVPARLEALAALGGVPAVALGAQIAAAAPMVLSMQKTASGRVLQQISVVEHNPVRVRTLWQRSKGWVEEAPW
ncbi:TadA family conjugal transfer-associated ATPase [Corynebacterium sp. 153RC1]|uniref:TadA family conjugal transfer-associated ATPase n=1 Tax=unclassified Corynebacterium TaxID=2624378 RepID=UPI00211BCC77|nr:MULTISPECIES: TadA family conjugal transfer-associated ATPase [unclassified Corynebacterium]MCQ9351727.1 TadA family conjugal transfer-associated ATPase [Corynebacterium sp. 209RC1]MCQ9354463.1 TadA family conjugal transfer-associated ATPase [Corynebacterium sp. 1222RC1]MCQ9356009.1 TadA family conjugal transfer-associated ATPase [Corynebacterium sp. 122RC1]MCQ9358641.1 TadA family conjugal transfer-associated ATPase [Corynebacterium sp. 142RC1]MCQ9360623.1 TadA family conjugal transfer-ass